MASNKARRMAKELADIHNDPHSHIRASAIGEDLTRLRGSFIGPPGTAYEGGTYEINIEIPNEYPFRPPVMKFATKIWHPNVSSQSVSLLISCHQHSQANCSGRYLSRYPVYRLVASAYYQICSLITTIPSQHPGAKGSPGCCSSSDADQEPQGI